MTVVVKSIKQWREIYKSFNNLDVGFVPTMGHLHTGHMSLAEQSKLNNKITVVSIFVNPTQFNNRQDLDNYPVNLEQDIKLLQDYNIDYLFCPDYHELYPDDYSYSVNESKLSAILEGRHRPGHFNGVLTVVLKLLNIIKANRVYFGEKDYQQAELVKKMVEAFFVETQVVVCPTVRLESGLACSSRNSNLSKQNIAQAHFLSELLRSNLSDSEIEQELINKGFKVDYIQEHNSRRYGAAWLDNVRLIDNVII